jgi:hypothetical protein
VLDCHKSPTYLFYLFFMVGLVDRGSSDMVSELRSWFNFFLSRNFLLCGFYLHQRPLGPQV